MKKPCKDMGNHQPTLLFHLFTVRAHQCLGKTRCACAWLCWGVVLACVWGLFSPRPGYGSDAIPPAGVWSVQTQLALEEHTGGVNRNGKGSTLLDYLAQNPDPLANQLEGSVSRSYTTTRLAVYYGSAWRRAWGLGVVHKSVRQAGNISAGAGAGAGSAAQSVIAGQQTKSLSALSEVSLERVYRLHLDDELIWDWRIGLALPAAKQQPYRYKHQLQIQPFGPSLYSRIELAHFPLGAPRTKIHWQLAARVFQATSQPSALSPNASGVHTLGGPEGRLRVDWITDLPPTLLGIGLSHRVVGSSTRSRQSQGDGGHVTNVHVTTGWGVFGALEHGVVAFPWRVKLEWTQSIAAHNSPTGTRVTVSWLSFF